MQQDERQIIKRKKIRQHLLVIPQVTAYLGSNLDQYFRAFDPLLFTVKRHRKTYLPNPSTQAKCKITSIFNRNATGFNSSTGCLTKLKESNLPNHLPITEKNIWNLTFPMVINAMWDASSLIQNLNLGGWIHLLNYKRVSSRESLVNTRVIQKFCNIFVIHSSFWRVTKVVQTVIGITCDRLYCGSWCADILYIALLRVWFESLTNERVINLRFSALRVWMPHTFVVRKGKTRLIKIR